jgi:RNA polymerase sigma-70 factor (ECF subfamily)
MTPSRTPVDAESLVPLVRAGDERALESIFRVHYGSLCTFASTMVRSRETAEELVQNVFLKVWTNRTRWDVRGSVRSYLFGAVRNEALNHLKRERLERQWLEEGGEEDTVIPIHGTLPAPDAGLEGPELAAAVRRAIEQLPPRARQAVQLRWDNQLRYAEIADVMGISVKGVENQLSRALEALRWLLGDRGE